MTGRQRDSERRFLTNGVTPRWRTCALPTASRSVRREYDYITIWGFWNGPDELLAAQDGIFYRAVNVKRAVTDKLIPRQTMMELMQRMSRRLADCGFEDLNLKPDHLLISFDAAQKLVLDTLGKPELRLCNFELIRRKNREMRNEI